MRPNISQFSYLTRTGIIAAAGLAFALACGGNEREPARQTEAAGGPQIGPPLGVSENAGPSLGGGLGGPSINGGASTGPSLGGSLGNGGGSGGGSGGGGGIGGGSGGSGGGDSCTESTSSGVGYCICEAGLAGTMSSCPSSLDCCYSNGTSCACIATSSLNGLSCSQYVTDVGNSYTQVSSCP